MKYIYLPEAFLPALKAAGVALHGSEAVKQLTSEEKLSGILSPSDVAFYWHLNIGDAAPLPAAVRASLTNALLATVASGTELTNRLRDYQLNQSAPALDVEGKLMSFKLIDEDTVLITHVDGEPETERDMYDRIIRVLHAIIPIDVLAKMPLFGEYLKAAQASVSVAETENTA